MDIRRAECRDMCIDMFYRQCTGTSIDSVQARPDVKSVSSDSDAASAKAASAKAASAKAAVAMAASSDGAKARAVAASSVAVKRNRRPRHGDRMPTPAGETLEFCEVEADGNCFFDSVQRSVDSQQRDPAVAVTDITRSPPSLSPI